MNGLRAISISFLVLLAWVTPAGPASAEQGGGDTASLELHRRTCPEVTADNDWYGTCHNVLSPRSEGGTVVMINQDTSERVESTLNQFGEATFALPPGRWYIEGPPGDFIEDAFAFCSAAATPAISIGHPVTVAAGDKVVCDFYVVPSDARGLEPHQIVSGAIYQGDCTPGAFVDPILVLHRAKPYGGSEVAVTPSAPLLASRTTGQLWIDTLFTEQTVIALFDPFAEEQELVACGVIGGPLNADGSMTVPLLEAQDSGIYGVANLIPDIEVGGITTVEIVIFDTTPDVSR